MKLLFIFITLSSWSLMVHGKSSDCVIKTINVNTGTVMGNQCYDFPDNLGQMEERMAQGLCNLPDNETFKHTVTDVSSCPKNTYGRCHFKNSIPGFKLSYTIHYYFVPHVSKDDVKRSCLAAKGEWI